MFVIGPVVRVAPNELSFNGGDAVDDIYGLRVILSSFTKYKKRNTGS